jgi:hypothetical protein
MTKVIKVFDHTSNLQIGEPERWIVLFSFKKIENNTFIHLSGPFPVEMERE